MNIWEMIQDISLAALPVIIAIGLLRIKKELKQYCGI